MLIPVIREIFYTIIISYNSYEDYLGFIVGCSFTGKFDSSYDFQSSKCDVINFLDLINHVNVSNVTANFIILSLSL